MKHGMDTSPSASLTSGTGQNKIYLKEQNISERTGAKKDTLGSTLERLQESESVGANGKQALSLRPLLFLSRFGARKHVML